VSSAGVRLVLELSSLRRLVSACVRAILSFPSFTDVVRIKTKCRDILALASAERYPWIPVFPRLQNSTERDTKSGMANKNIPVCEIHNKPMVCLTCRGIAGGRKKSPAKRIAAIANGEKGRVSRWGARA
jgi:hypothetical protein